MLHRGFLKIAMKTARDPRHIKRIEIVKQLFAQGFAPQTGLSKETKEILAQKDLLDAKIAKAAPAWPIEKINKIDLSILRLSVYELENSDIPFKVIIDEAVELAKNFGSENSSSFVNGVLGTIYKSSQTK